MTYFGFLNISLLGQFAGYLSANFSDIEFIQCRFMPTLSLRSDLKVL